jgi:S-formylglutathione hydrolase FrmB
MRKSIVSVLLFLSIFQLSIAAEFEKKQFFSTSLNREQTYFVSLPDGYDQNDATKKFPVIIFLHGASVDAQDIVNLFEPLLSNPFSRLLFQKMFKVIFVIPSGKASPYLGSFYTNSELYGNFEDYISSDLLTEISTNYHTIDHREKWAIMGHSMGGYGATKIALKNPEKFIGFATLSGPLHTTYYTDLLPMILAEHGNAAPYNFNYQGDVTKLVYSMAGAFSPDTTVDPPVVFPILNDGTVNQAIMPSWEEQNPINLIQSWNGNPQMAVFMYCGEQDEYKLLAQNKLFSDSLNHYNISHKFTIDPNGDHSTSIATSFPQGLNFLVNVMDTATIRTTSVIAINTSKINIYPNPVKDKLYLSSDFNLDISEVAVLSLSGVILKRFTGLKSSRIFPVNELKPGCYLLRICHSNGQTSKFRFVKTDS